MSSGPISLPDFTKPASSLLMNVVLLPPCPSGTV